MRAALIASGLIVAAGTAVYFMPAELFGGGAQYPLTVAQAKALLLQADLRNGSLPFGTLKVRRSSSGSGEVHYAVRGRAAAIDCRAALTAVGEGSDVATHCERTLPGGAVSAGAGGATDERVNDSAFAEYIAAILGRRAFDEAKMAGAGLTAPPRKSGATRPGTEQAADDGNGAADDGDDDARPEGADAAAGDDAAPQDDGGDRDQGE